MRAKPIVAILVVAFVIGLALRLRHFDTTPPPLETADEFAWTWAGMSLLRTGVPHSWSYLDAYRGGEAHQFRGQTFKIVSPWLDHPPLFALVMGAWVRVNGFTDPYALSLGVMRCVPLTLWIIAFVLLALVLARMFEPMHTALAMVVFALSPPMVIQSKLVIAESLLVPLALVAYLLILRQLERRRRLEQVALFACALLLPLAKIAALSLSCWLLLVALRRRAVALAALIAGATLLALGLYAAYGAHFGWSQFSAVQQAHAGRFVGFNSGLILLVSTHIVERGLIYPLFLVAGIGAIADAAEDRGVDLYLGALVYAGCMTFFADHRSVYGWYWLPLYPALAAGVAGFAWRAWRRDDAVYHVIAAVMLVPFAMQIILELDWSRRQMLRFVYLGLMGLFALLLLWPRERGRPWARRAVLITVFSLQLAADLLYDLRG